MSYGGCWRDCAIFWRPKGVLFVAKRTPFAARLSLRCIAKGLQLIANITTFAMQWRLFCLKTRCRTLWKRLKTPCEISRINFLFVTLFYCMYDISQGEFWILSFEFWVVLGCACDFELLNFELFAKRLLTISYAIHSSPYSSSYFNLASIFATNATFFGVF